MAQAVTMGPYYRVRCTWPPNQLPEGVTITYSDHPDLENSIRAVGLIHKHGFGGMGTVFPLEMYIVEPTGAEYRICPDGFLNTGIKAADLPRILKALNEAGRSNHSNEKNETEKPLNRRERRAKASEQRRAAKRAKPAEPVEASFTPSTPKARRWLLNKLRERGGNNVRK